MSNAIYPPYDQTMAQQNTNEFDYKGHPGKFHRVISPSGNVWFTGSNFGAGAILPASGAAGTVFLTNGGSLNASLLAPGHIHELSIERVESAANIYILIRNQVVR
jgi:hypothetical protein